MGPLGRSFFALSATTAKRLEFIPVRNFVNLDANNSYDFRAFVVVALI